MNTAIDFANEDRELLLSIMEKGELETGELSPPIRKLLARSHTPFRILLAEDCPDTALLLSHFLENVGFEVTAVGNGEDCFALGCAAHESREDFDVVIVDLALPKLGGFDVVRFLRRAGYHGTTVAITGRALPADRLECKRVGCNGYLQKSEVHTKLLPFLATHLH